MVTEGKRRCPGQGFGLGNEAMLLCPVYAGTQSRVSEFIYQNFRAPSPHLIAWQDVWSFPGPRCLVIALAFLSPQSGCCPSTPLVSVLLYVHALPTCECFSLSSASISRGPSRSPQPLLRRGQNKISYTFMLQETLFSASSTRACSDGQICPRYFSHAHADEGVWLPESPLQGSETSDIS